jgi:hypothetical protein
MRRRLHHGFTAACLVAACASSNAPEGELEPDTHVDAPLCSSEEGTLGSAPLRRLTRFEYGRTLADLLGADPSIANELPPDERSLGYDGMADTYSVSTLHAAKYLEVAERAAAALVGDVSRLSAFAGCNPTAADDCVEPFVRAFGRRAYRRTLIDDEVSAMLALHAATATPAAADGVSAVVAAMLQAPQFIYRAEPAAPDEAFGAALATRVAYLITASTPDDELLDAAESGALDTNEGLLAQTDRLLATTRASEAFSHFMLEWWELESSGSVQKDQALYRAWNEQVQRRLPLETQAFLDAAWAATPSLDVFFGASYTYVDPTLATFYGLAAPSGSSFTRVNLDPTRAAGLLTQGAFLAVHAKPNQTSPIHRGKFVRERLFCDQLEPPPPDIVVAPPAVDPRLSTRERFAQHTESPSCAGCHALMDPIGFAFESYDAVGRWRDTDSGKPVDATGRLDGTDVDGELDGVPSLAKKLLESEQVRSCVARQWFRYAFGRDATTAADTCTVNALGAELGRSQGNLRAVMRATVEQELFRAQRPAEVNQ